MSVNTSPVRVAIVDSERMLAEALGEWFCSSGSALRLVARASTWDALFSHPEFPVDVVLACLDCARDEPIGVHIATAKQLGSEVLAIAKRSSTSMLRAVLPAGANGFVSKTESLAMLERAIIAIADGSSHLSGDDAAEILGATTPQLSFQERRVMRLYASGMTVRQVGNALGITEETAKSYLKRIREKYRAIGKEIGTKVALHRQAVSEGLLDE